MVGAGTAWTPEHFIGGHPALDLINTVFDRRIPAEGNELLKSAVDVADWFRATGLAEENQARQIADHATAETVEAVHGLRETSYAIFNDLASNRDPAPGQLGLVMTTAAAALTAGAIAIDGTRPAPASRWSEPQGVPGFLAMLSLDGYYTLPRDRIRSCPRCGWLFLDTSRGGKRRWCSMKTCGNREKISRHRNKPDQ